MKFRVLIGICVVVTAVWSGVWFFAQSQTKAALTRWMDDRQQAGWDVPPDGFSVTGYPNRLDASADPWLLADPNAGWQWEAPFLKLYALMYRPTHIIARFAPEQTVTYRDQARQSHTVALKSEPLEASVIFSDITAQFPVLEQMDIAGEALSLSLSGNLLDEIRTDVLKAHVRQTPDTTDSAGTYDVVTVLNGLELPDNIWQGVDAEQRLGSLDQTFRAETQVTFTQPLDTTILNGLPPVIEAMDVNALNLEIGSLGIQAQGRLEVGPEGFPVGELTTTVTGWQDALALAQDSGALSQNESAVVTMALQFLAGGDQNTITAPLSFQRGRIFLGPIPIGYAPKIRP